MVYRQSGKVIGSLGLHSCGERFGELKVKEIGYVLSKSYRGMGLIPEAVSRVIDFCFDTLMLDAVTAEHFETNSQSRRVIEKCGFKFFRKRIYDAKQLGKQFDCLSYILTSSDWKNSK